MDLGLQPGSEGDALGPEYGWWALPVPLRPDLTAQEARDDMAVTVKHMLAPLREL
ncbi:hypothetical protein LN042_16460 [Kitasatospora sp. RB6PN24]|uniref:hypothetical protein n=1 Tax=Kitasatospora humi TaxID=2893891 RepID=UPI001E607F30|nr:hypothetical protein [Kitasatospora humi]MCC9308654.1 hypothetical protein [Kitasatospora humi]